VSGAQKHDQTHIGAVKMDQSNTVFSHVQQGLDAMERIASFWQQTMKTQMGEIDAVVGKVDAFMKANVVKAEGHLEEVSKLTKSAMQWATELQMNALNSALQMARTASESFQKARN